MLGLLALVRGNALLVAPAILLLAYIKRGRQSLGNCAAVTLATLLFIVPATIHNAIVSHDFVLMNYDDGFNFYIGNSPSATGALADIAEGRDIARLGVMIVSEEEWTTRFAEQVRGRTLQPSEISAFWRDRAFDFIAQNPRHSLSLLLEKFRLFFYVGDFPDNYIIGFIAENFPTILSSPLPGLCLASVAAVFSLVGLCRGRKSEAIATLAILAGIYMLSVLLSYVTERYRLSIEVFLLPLAGATVPCAWELVRFRQWGRLMAATTLAGLLLIVGLNPGIPDPAYGSGDCLFLGKIYHNLGQYQNAMKWFRKTAEQSSSSAQFNSVVMYSLEAQFNLGVMYQEGEGVPQDYAQAMRWYRQAAEQGLAPAQHDLGKLYYLGQGVPQDYVQAVQWFRQAAEHGLAPAQFNLGVMYFKGEGVPRDPQQAIKWFRESGQRGDLDAQNYLGIIYHDGLGAPPDHMQAMQWFRIAAEHGLASAQFNLGVMYFKGEGVPRDTEQAIEWFRKAAAQGDTGALHNLGVISHADDGAAQN